MSLRDRVLDALQRLVLAGDPTPTLDAVAAAAGVSKGGLLHHFPDRQALAHGLVHRALAETDATMATAAERGTAAATWLRLSAADGPEQAAARALLSVLRVSAGGVDLPADVVRLVGDGLFTEALLGAAPAPERVEALIAHLLTGTSGGGRESAR